VDLDRRSLSTAAGDTRVGAIAVRAPLELDSSSVRNCESFSKVGKIQSKETLLT